MNKNFKKLIKKNSLLFKMLSNIKNYKLNQRAKYFENIFENVIEGSIVIKIKNIPGEYEIDPRSHVLKQILLAKEKEYEPEIVESILKNIDPNKDAINIGANIGLYSNLLAYNIKPERKVLAIEPTPRAFKMLKNNTKRNHNEKKVLFFNGIAANKNGNYDINIIKGKEEYSSLGKLVHPSIRNTDFIVERVKGLTIDSLVVKHNLKPGILVIDVEGSELNVLKGAIKTLRLYHPIIISEAYDELLLNQNADSRKLIKFLEDLNYTILDINKGNIDFPFNGNIIASSKIPLNTINE